MITKLSRSLRLLFDQLNVVVTLIAQISDSRSSCQYSRRQLLDHPGLGCGILEVSFAKKLDVDISKVDESGKKVQKLLTLTAQTLDLRCFRGRVECVCVSGACRWGESSGGCILHDSVRQAIADNFAQRG